MIEKEEIVQKSYNKIAQKYLDNRHTWDNSNELKEFARLLPKGAKVLDIGCGGGIPVADFLIKSGLDVTGIDFAEEMLKLARKNVPKARLFLNDMNELCFKDNSFEGLTALYSIIHVPREKHYDLMQSFHRILKPGGVMLICMGPDEWEAVDEFLGVQMFWSHYDPEISLQLVKDAGFQIIFGKYIRISGEIHFWILAKNE